MAIADGGASAASGGLETALAKFILKKAGFASGNVKIETPPLAPDYFSSDEEAVRPRTVARSSCEAELVGMGLAGGDDSDLERDDKNDKEKQNVRQQVLQTMFYLR